MDKLYINYTVLVYKLLLNIIYTIIKLKTLRYKTFQSTAKVCKKEYVPEHNYCQMILCGKTMVPSTIHYDEEYNVCVMYNGVKHWFTNKYLYDKVNIGDIVPVLVHKGYNEEGILKNIYITIDD